MSRFFREHRSLEIATAASSRRRSSMHCVAMPSWDGCNRPCRSAPRLAALVTLAVIRVDAIDQRALRRCDAVKHVLAVDLSRRRLGARRNADVAVHAVGGQYDDASPLIATLADPRH
jgi:hypothetical protein